MANYFQKSVKYLLRQPAFRNNPIGLLARGAVWLGYCAIGHSPQFVLRDGVRFQVVPILRHSGSSSAFILRDWAEPELRYLDQLLEPGDTFIDCGANIGIYTVIGAGAVGPRGRVVAVEPSAVSFERLSRNLAVNQFKHVALVNKAISDTVGTARLYHADGGPVSFSLVEKQDVEFEDVPTITIDEIVAQNNLAGVDCIKLDVEGVEVPALRGGGATLSRFKPTVIFERTSAGQQRRGQEDISAYMKARGYRIYRYRGLTRAEAGYSSPNFIAIHPDGGKAVPAVLELVPADEEAPAAVH